jgi:hypothetical protein
MMVQEGVGGVLQRRYAAGKSYNLPHRVPLFWCRSKRGQLEHPTQPRRSRPSRRRETVAAANRLFAAATAG